MNAVLPPTVKIALQSLVPSVVRTLFPVVFALVVRVGFNETSIDSAWLERVLTVVVTMGYYVAVRLLEQYWDKVGWLLGYAKQPVYVQGQILSVTPQPNVPTDPPTTTTEVVTDAAPDDQPELPLEPNNEV